METKSHKRLLHTLVLIINETYSITNKQVFVRDMSNAFTCIILQLSTATTNVDKRPRPVPYMYAYRVT